MGSILLSRLSLLQQTGRPIALGSGQILEQYEGSQQPILLILRTAVFYSYAVLLP